MNSMTVTNQLGESLELVLREPEKTGLLVSSIKGLGEPDVKVNITEGGLSDYSRLNSARLQPREIEIELLYVGEDIEASRLTAYKYFPSKAVITLLFKTDYREVICTGIVEKHEPTIFSKECGCNISIKCPDPFFYDLNQSKVIFDAIDPMFHFPFSDAPSDELQFGNIRVVKEKIIYYVGEAETGVTIDIECMGTIRGLTIYNLDTGQRLGIKDDVLEEIFGTSLMEQDEVIIITNKGSKSAYLIRNGVTYNIINAIDRRTTINDWFELVNGDNVFTYTASTGEEDIKMNIRHRVLYKGV